MNVFKTLRDHLIASGVLFTDRQIANAVSELYNQMRIVWGNFKSLDDKVVELESANEQLRGEVYEGHRLTGNFERDFRKLEHEYHDLVRYCLRLEERIKNNEALLVSLTNPTNKKQ